MEFENQDPRGEYVRICPYCHEQFIAQHMNRTFCPEKNGIVDYCKNRYKRIRKLEDHEPLAVEIAETPITPQLLQKPNFEQVAPITIDQQIEKMNILSTALGNGNKIKLAKNYLLNAGFGYENYDGRYLIPNSELYVLTYGPYAIAWAFENHVILTLKKLLTWIP